MQYVGLNNSKKNIPLSSEIYEILEIYVCLFENTVIKADLIRSIFITFSAKIRFRSWFFWEIHVV